ncbi:YktB family protein [Amphibacillus marinus]
MTAIQETIQPKFKVIGTELTDYLATQLGNEMFLHIAKHARRSVNPPNDTWLAIANNKRGYKKHPHFQVGLFDDHLFIWLAFIYELPQKANVARTFLANIDQIKALASDFVISFDHMKKDAIPVNQLTKEQLKRFKDVKKAEFLIGKQLSKEQASTLSEADLLATIKDAYNALLPYYQLSLKSLA